MRNAIHFQVTFILIIVFNFNTATSQENKNMQSSNTAMTDSHKKGDHYMELKKMGYEEKEIFEDLGNANFLAEDYATALFWYDRLKEYCPNGTLSSNYQKRYQYAFRKTQGLRVAQVPQSLDWLTMIKRDYELDKKYTTSVASNEMSNQSKNKSSRLKSENFVVGKSSRTNRKYPLGVTKSNKENMYEVPIALTADGNTAYFSKAVYQKPLHGIFSKKEVVHKIYQANKVNGEWKEIKEIGLCPKYASALHPTISEDGKRLFFASNMPGSYGDYDIYVTSIHNDGSFGRVKNLGNKINTKRNELYPNLANNSTLFFASEGHEGEGGLDIYVAQVDKKAVGYAMNLGSNINSREDDFSISLETNDRMGYVMSNRGRNIETIQQVAFTYNTKAVDENENKRMYDFAEIIESDSKTDYTSNLYEDE